MSRRRRLIAAALACLLLCLPLSTGDLSAAASIEGRWRLVEQGRGPAGPGPPLTGEPFAVEFHKHGAALMGRVWPRGTSLPPRPWPSFDQEGTPLPVIVEAIEVEPGLGGVAVRFRASGTGGREILIEESFHLEDGGRALAGRVRVTDVVEGKPGGSYVLHRRFERQP